MPTATQTPVPAATEHFLTAIGDRRTIYVLNKDLPITEVQAVKLVKAAVRAAPTEFPIKTTRAVVLLGDHHDDFWRIVKKALYKVTSAESAAAGAGKIEACFQSGAGTVLFFEDDKAIAETAAVHGVACAARGGAEYCATSAHKSCGAAQFAVWSVLSQAGCGASLQHYEALVGEPVRKAFRIPPWWRLGAMLPFGGVGAPAGEKTFLPMESLLTVRDEDGLSSYGGGAGSSRRGASSGEDHREL